MHAAGVDAVLAASPGLVAFLTGHVIPANLAYPSRDARVGQATTAVVTGDAVLTVGRAPNPTVGESIRYEPVGLDQSDDVVSYAALVNALRGIGIANGRIAVELGSFPATGFEAVSRALPGLEIRGLGCLFAAAKAAKSDEEISGIAAACRLTDAAHAAIRQAIRPGVREVELYSAAVEAMNDLAGGHVLGGCELMSGSRTIDPGPAPVPTERSVELGEVVMSDVYPRHPNGWWSDSCSSVVCGNARELQAPWRKLVDALEAGAERLRPGVTAGEVYDAVAEHAGPQVPYVGHGIGRDHFEEPVIREGNQDRLPEQGVIVLEPGYRDGRQALRLEWAYRITAEGGQPLTAFSLDL